MAGRTLLVGLLGLGLASSAAALSFGFGGHSGGLVHTLEFKHTLRVCNAYPYAGALDVYRDRGEKEKLTHDKPMPYKACRDLATHLKSGDKLEFKVGDASAGSFSVADLPDNDAVLLLVCHRHDVVSTAMSFESHVFGNLANAQVAIIDAYKGAQHATPHIKDVKATKSKRDEPLRFDSVVAVNQGKYEIVLDKDVNGKQMAKVPLVALNHESYVIMRTGVEAKEGESYAEELVVFPQSDPASLPHSAAAPVRHLSVVSSLLVLLAAAAATVA